MKPFARRRVFITGAGSGLGRALTLGYAADGWKVGVAEIDPARTEETVRQVNAAGGEGLAIACDVTREAELAAAARQMEETWQGVDVVINNAGVSGCGLVADIPAEKWDWILGINLKGTINGCRAFIPLLEKSRGHLVNVASYLGFINTPESSCYNVTKAGIISLSETLRVELAKSGVGVSVVMPSFFRTNLMDQLYAADERQRVLTTSLFEKATFTAEAVAAAVMKGVRKNRLYILPQWDAKLLWHFKRCFPGLYFRTFSYIYKKGLVEKYFGLPL